MSSYSLVCTVPWDFTTVPTSRHLRFRFTFQGVTVQPYASGASNSASQPKQLRFCLSVPALSTPLHSPSSHSPSILPLSPGSLNSASQPKQLQSRQSQLCLTAQAAAVLPLSPGTLNSASQPKQSQFQHSASQSKQSQFRLKARYR